MATCRRAGCGEPVQPGAAHRFNELVNSAHKLYGSRAPSENDVVLLRNKASVVIKLFLSSDIPPKLRVGRPQP